MTAQLSAFRAVTCAALGVLGLVTVAQAQEPAVLHACVTPLTGLLYQPREEGRCFHSTHRPISWTDGAGAFPAASALGGDLSGTLPAPTVTGLQGRPVSAAAPAVGDVVTWNGTEWEPAPPSAPVIESPNGQFSLRVTDTGIELNGPGGFVKINATGVEVRSNATVALQANTALDIRGGTTVDMRSGTDMSIRAGNGLAMQAGGPADLSGGGLVTVRGAIVNLNAAAGGCPVAKQGSDVSGSANLGNGVVTGTVLNGSPTVVVPC